jgi:DNA-binding transcriptional regulator GbsR (MarR family)
MDNAYQAAIDKFVHSWGEMGSKWGINKTMAQIHALLMASEKPLSTDEVMEQLQISRGNANSNLRALADWGIVRRSFVKGDRKEYFQSEKDVWTMFCRIARERKKRELVPAIEALQECLSLVEKDRKAAHLKSRLLDLLDLLKTGDQALEKIANQERSKIIPRILKLLT